MKAEDIKDWEDVTWKYVKDKPPRFMTEADASAYLAGNYSKAIFMDDQRYLYAPYEYTILMSPSTCRRFITANPKNMIASNPDHPTALS